MLNLKNRYGPWALVTGASSGIGAALVKQLAGEGLNIVSVARTQAKLDEQAKSLRAEFGVEVRTVAADLSSEGGAQTVMQAVSDLEIGMFIPCAAVENRGYFIDESYERHQALLQMDVITPMTLVHHFASKMASRQRGAVLLVSSLSGWMSQPYMAHYGAAKAYILALGDALHHEMKDKGVDVAVLSPGPTDTPMAAAVGIDFAAMGMQVMQPSPVATVGLAALGQKPHAVPGARNRMMVFMTSRLMPRRWVGAMMKMMMGKALKIAPTPAIQGN
jgi:short-subunit dehydrogenase